MKTLAILSRKGGTGKTLLAVHLAVAAELAGHTAVLIDLDPQESSSQWGESRDRDTPAVVATYPERLTEILQLAEENGATLAIIDTSPNTEESARDAARAADLVAIPCKPDAVSLRAIDQTIQLIDLTKVSARIVLNDVPARGDYAEQAREAVKIYGIPTAPCVVGHRMPFVHAFNASLSVQEYEPKGKASTEIRALYEYLAGEMGV